MNGIPPPDRNSARPAFCAAVSACSAGICLLSGARSGVRLESELQYEDDRAHGRPGHTDAGTKCPGDGVERPRERRRHRDRLRRFGTRSAALGLVVGRSPSSAITAIQARAAAAAPAQGSQGNGSTAGNGQERQGQRPAGRRSQRKSASSQTSSDDGGSSPLVPILIAIAVLAAISIGVVVMQAAAPARRRRRARSRRRRARPMSRATDANRAGERVPGRLALAVAMLGAGAVRHAPRRRSRPTFWGVVPQATPSQEQFQRLQARRRRQHPDPDRLGRDAADPGRRSRLVRRSTPWSPRPPTPASRCCPSSTAPRPGRCPRSGCPAPAHGQGARATCRSRPAPPAGAWTNFVSRRGRPLRARRQLLGREPAGPEAPDPHLADLERAQLQVLRRQARTRPNTGSSVKLSYARSERRRRRAPSSSSAASSRAPRGGNRRRKSRKRGLLRLRLPRTDVRDDARDQGASSTASPCTPTPASYQELTPDDRRSARGPEGARRRRQGRSGSPSSAGARSRRRPTAS